MQFTTIKRDGNVERILYLIDPTFYNLLSDFADTLKEALNASSIFNYSHVLVMG